MTRALRLGFAIPVLLSVPAVLVSAQDPSHDCPMKWVGRSAEFEELLLTADIVSVEDIGTGVTKPSRVVLRKGDVEIAAAFKPIKRGRQKGFWESYQAEVAAYRLDRMIGLDMVPPTVERSVKRRTGSLQLWVDDCKLYKEVQKKRPNRPVEWSHQLSNMKMFDMLIMNNDRNAQNFLVDPGWDIVLIDHSRAFISEKNIRKDEKRLPAQFDRELVEKLKSLEKDELEQQMKGLLMGGQIKSLLERRDNLLDYLDELITDKGEARVLFD